MIKANSISKCAVSPFRPKILPARPSVQSESPARSGANPVRRSKQKRKPSRPPAHDCLPRSDKRRRKILARARGAGEIGRASCREEGKSSDSRAAIDKKRQNTEKTVA